jgi:tetratricopeptide (TPR) repeat protein
MFLKKNTKNLYAGRLASFPPRCYHAAAQDGFRPLPGFPPQSHPHAMTLRIAVAFVVCVVASLSAASAAPYLPTRDDRVLEHLPLRANDPIAKEIATLRATLRSDPNNVVVAVKLARRYYEQVAEEGDPRYLGYAQAALAPWWEMTTPPTDVQVLRASLAQFRHDFDGALTDLSAVIQREPRNSQARALRATIHIVQARYDQARADCQALHGATSELIATGCEAMVDGLTGKVAPAYATLVESYRNHPQATPAEKLWVLIRLAEMAQRQVHDEAAEGHFREALALHITDTFLLSAYADFLLDQKRYAEVQAMLKDKTPSDGLLLRLALAERELKAPTAAERAAQLSARYQAAGMRGDTVHQQEESRFDLQVFNDARRALMLASENWKVQKEPRDARVLLEAAKAAREPDAAMPVVAWLKSSHLEDPFLTDLARQAKEPRK